MAIKKEKQYMFVVATTTVAGSTKIVCEDGVVQLFTTRDSALKYEQSFVNQLKEKLNLKVKTGLFSREFKYTESQKREIIQMINTIHVRKVELPLRSIV